MKTKKTFASSLALFLLTFCLIMSLASCEQLAGLIPGTTEATTPDAETTSPDTETTAPDTETIAPDTETTGPDTETTAPDSGDNKPDTETTTPDSGDNKPDTETTTPDSGDNKPDTETTTPDSGDNKPDVETSVPDTETTVPDTETTVPDTETTVPDSGEDKPGEDKPGDNTGDTSDLYYFNFADSFSTIDGIAIRIENFVIEVETNDSTPNGLQKINSLEVAELEISLKDGELYGAAHGKAYVTFFDTLNGTVEFSAIISDGYLYLAVTGDAGDMNEQMYQKYALEDLLGDPMSGMGGADEEMVNSITAFVEDTLLPVVESLIEENKVSIDAALGKVLNILFTFEKQEDGTVLVTLSKDKVLALNDALATKSIAEVIDLYFGEGTYDGIVDSIFEILDLKISEIPAYLESKGIDYDELIAKIEEFLPLVGAPEDFDIDELINNSDYSELVIGDLLMGFIGSAGPADAEKVENAEDVENAEGGKDAEGTEGEEAPTINYKEFIEENILAMLEGASLYEMIGAPEDAKEMIDKIIAQVFDLVNLSLVTEEKGAFTALEVTLNKVPVGGSSMGSVDSPNGGIVEEKPNEDSAIGSISGAAKGTMTSANATNVITYTYYLSTTIEIVANGTVEVTWGDIIEKVNASLAPIPEDIKKEEGFRVDSDTWPEEGVLFFQGQEYVCGHYTVWVEETDFDTVLSTSIYSDCDGWFNYSVQVFQKEYKYQVYFLSDYDYSGSPVIFFMVNPYTDEILKVEQVSGGFNVTDESGETKYIIMATGDENMMTITAKLFPLAFEDVDFSNDSTSVDFYYNPTTKEYAFEEQHEWEYTYKLLGKTCKEGYEYTKACTKCGDKTTGTEYSHEWEYNEIDFGELGLCGGWINERSCTICKETYAEMYNDCNWVGGEKVDGYEIYTCENCKATKKYKTFTTEKDENCQYTTTETHVYIVNGEEVYSTEITRINTNHTIEYSYEKYGETCNDGYMITAVCTGCGMKDTWERYGHTCEVQEMDLGELGLCGGNVCKEYCTLCDTVINVDAYDECCWNSVESVDGYEIYKCESCGATKKLQRSVTEGETGCEQKITETIIYIVENEEVFSYTNNYSSSTHNWERSYELFGETCDDGYRVTEYCTKCGQKYSWEDGGHYTNVDKYELSEFGLCGGHLAVDYCRVCEKVMDINYEAYRCNWETVEETDTTFTQKCTVCNVTVTEIYNDEGYTLIIEKDGEEVFNETVYNEK